MNGSDTREGLTTVDDWFRRIVEAVPQALILLDAGGAIVAVNPAAEAILGAPRESMLRSPIRDYIPDLNSDSVSVARPHHSSETPGRRLDGAALSLQVSQRWITSLPTPHVLVSIVDVSERVELDLARARMQALVEGAEDAIIVKDLDGRILSWNPAATRLLGYTPEEILGEPITRLIPPDRADEEVAILDKIRRGERVSHLETVRLTRDGRPIDVSLTISPIRDRRGEIVGASKILRDISPQRQADALFRLAVDSSPTALILIDERSSIILMNQKAEDLFGHRLTSLVGAPLEVLIPERFRATHRDHVREYLGAPHARAMGSGRALFAMRRDGSEFPVEIALNPLRTATGVRTIASVIDITERRRVEDELRRSNAELEQFAYIASHDLQEPLRMVASYTELLSQRYKGQLDERADRFIHYAVDGARRMQHLIADLLSYSRVGSQGKVLAPVDAGAIAQRAIEVMRRVIAETSATVTVEPLPRVLADEGQLAQLFENLLSNALKFRRACPPEVSVRAARHNDRWLFSVSDNGIGIESQHSARIFQMFQRLHGRGQYEGSGIGLAIAMRIVERHGGQIWFESTPGVGSTFFFTLQGVPELPED